LLTDRTDGIVLALDEADVRDSRSLLLFPRRAGMVSLTTRATWKRPVAEVGEVRHSTWHTLDTRPCTVLRSGETPAGGRTLRVTLTDDHALSLVWIGEDGESRANWRAEIQRRMAEPCAANTSP
jgi:hypothetical protein